MMKCKLLLIILCCTLCMIAECKTSGIRRYVVSDQDNTMFGILFPQKSIQRCKYNKARNHVLVILKISDKMQLNGMRKTCTNNKFITHYEIKKYKQFYALKVYISADSEYLRTKCTPSSLNIYVKNHRKKRTVLIDPGHGGRDPGSLSSDMIHEKGITIAFAKFIKQELEKTGRYAVYLTRKDDITLSRMKRLAMITKINPDVFISIHADNISNSDVSGVSVYTLRDKKKQECADLLHKDLSNCSVELATIFLKYIPEMFKLKKNARRASEIRILKNNVPSILIETGYISNAKDKILLRSDIFREKLAQSLVYSLDEFFIKD